jgi:hypothetical protein
MGATEEKEDVEVVVVVVEVVVISLSVSCRTENGKQTIVELPGTWNPDW